MYSEEDSAGSDFFGPGADLIMSLLLVMILIGVGAMFKRDYEKAKMSEEIAKRGKCPPPVVYPEEKKRPEEKERPKVDDLRIGLVPTRDSESFFDEGSARLTAAGQNVLRSQVNSIKRALESGDYQSLDIVGYASPSPNIAYQSLAARSNATNEPASAQSGRYEVDRNLDLSAERAAAVAHYLHLFEIPYECMRAAGWGRAQSEYRKRLERERGWNHEAFDRSQIWEQVESGRDWDFTKEQRVEIFGVKNPSAPSCLSRSPGPALEN